MMNGAGVMEPDDELSQIAQALEGAQRFRVECRDCGKDMTGWVKPSAPSLACPFCHSRNTFRMPVPKVK
jgi:hypothetical protein